MKKTIERLPVHVQFLFNAKENDLFAFFPNDVYSHSKTAKCYSHIGQHSECSIEYAKESSFVSPEQYADLKTELENIGYKLIVVTPVKHGDNITIIGRRWFDRINGNTYFSAVGLINNIQVVEIHFEYGYGNHYEDRIYQELEKAGYFPDVEHYSNGGREAFWQYCNRKGLTKYVTHSDVNRKKDL